MKFYQKRPCEVKRIFSGISVRREQNPIHHLDIEVHHAEFEDYAVTEDHAVTEIHAVFYTKLYI